MGKLLRTPLVCLVLLVGAAVPCLAIGSSAKADAAAGDGAPMPELHWRMIGPFRGGRTRAAAGVPGEPNVFYIGQVNGGVWKSTDDGRIWKPIFDGEGTQSIGAIAVAPSDPNIVYVASGEGLHRPDLSVGDGIYRSTDAGNTWVHLGLRDGEQIAALAVDPTNPQRLFAAVLGHPYGPSTERGIFRSDDGGTSWTKVLYKDASTGGSAVVLDPKHPQTVYASLWSARLGPWEDGNSYERTDGGLFKSVDGGTTWKPLTKGLPADLVQINIALAPSQPQRLYATVSTKVESGYASGKGLGVFRSEDGGESWAKITDDPRPALKIGGGDLPVPVVDPQNPDVVYSASIVTERSTDGGKTWTSLRGAPGGDDYQNLWINPQNPKIVLLVSDQGAVVSVNGGESWSSWYNQPTAQLYHVAATNTFPYQVCAGQQESGSVCIATRGNDGQITFRDWHPAGIIEYGYAAPDPLNPRLIYGAGRFEVSRYDMLTGQVQNVTPLPMKKPGFRADRTEPILFSPVDPHTMFYAANHLFKTTDGGGSWQTISPDLSRETTGQPPSVPTLSAAGQAQRRGVIYAVAASYKTVGTLWAGTDDGLLWLTRDGGTTWSKITPPGIAPWSKIAQVEATRFDDQTAYVAVNAARIDDMQPHAFCTHDGGATWRSISAGLPESAPVNAVRADPQRPGLLYAATENGVWVSLDDGATWRALQFNLPHTSMRDLLVKDDDLIVATHGRSFWVLDDISPLRAMAVEGSGGAPLLFKPADAWRVRRDTNTDTPLPADEPAGENPPDGAIVDYKLERASQGPVTLEILDGEGQVLRRYSSTDPVLPEPAELQTALIPAYWPKRSAPLPASAGMHRWVWDLRATPPRSPHGEYPIAAVPGRTPQGPQGPLLPPGVYTARLSADGKTASESFVVKMDARVLASPADVQALYKAESSMALSLDALGRADLAAHAAEEQAGKMSVPSKGPLAAQVRAFRRELRELLEGDKDEEKGTGSADASAGTRSATGKEPSTKQAAPATPARQHLPGLDEVTAEATALYAQIGAADSAPTPALLAAAEHAQAEGKSVLPRWERLKSSGLPKLNRALQAAHQPVIDLGRGLDSMPEQGDED